MYSLGAVALLDDGTRVGDFEVNLQELDGAKGDPETMAWWAKQPKEILEAARRAALPPAQAMEAFTAWVNRVSRDNGNLPPTAVAYPAGFDFMFVYWYIRRFGLSSPFSFSCLDIKTYAAAVLGVPYRKAVKKNMPESWFAGLPAHTHKAIDDALEQGLLFLNIRNHGKS